MDRYNKLLLNNEAWVTEKLNLDKDFFRKQSESQHPPFLWIGCADSRVPPDEITGSHAGDMFVHRNIANIVSHSDLNLMSVLEYGILSLEVDHIIVCGHTRCGGVKAALGHRKLGIIDKWIRGIKDIYHEHRDELINLEDENKVWDKLVELNVKDQVMNLAKTSFVQKRWSEGKFPVLHGWVYHLEDGRLEAVSQITKDDDIDDIYRYNFDEEPTL